MRRCPAAKVSSAATCPKVWFRLGEPGPGEVGFAAGELVSRLGDRAISLGRPAGSARGFMADAAAAAAAALSFGLDADAVGEGVRSVEPLPHRGRIVARVGSVAFVDDSKATNPHAALAALEGRHDVVLIAGGLAKGVDLSPLATATDVEFAWAQCGSGAHRLGEAILADAMGASWLSVGEQAGLRRDVGLGAVDEPVGEVVERFVKEIIDGLPLDGFELSTADVRGWLRQQPLGTAAA